MTKNSGALHALPFPRSNLKRTHKAQKRKRRISPTSATEEREKSLAIERDQQDHVNIEYSSVLTPDERSQRRLAGYPLDREPPSFPFPHTSGPSSKPRRRSRQDGAGDLGTETRLNDGYNMSFKIQHVAAIVAVLHKYLNSRDYHRASRAFALLVRTKLLGNMVDLRQCGLWGIAAELLLQSGVELNVGSIFKDNLEKVKAFYNRLALQHPWQRRWSDIVDAQEFKSATFALWIYMVCVESEKMQTGESLEDPDLPQSSRRTTHRAKSWEIDEAEKIAKELDALLRVVPFVDNLELIRMRGMVALWLADLCEAVEQDCDESESTGSEYHDGNRQASPSVAGLGIQVHGSRSLQQVQGSTKASDARNIASIMFGKLSGQREDNDDGFSPKE